MNILYEELALHLTVLDSTPLNHYLNIIIRLLTIEILRESKERQ